MSKRPRVLVVVTGGTLAMAASAARPHTLAPAELGDLGKIVPDLGVVAEVEMLPLLNLDSADLQPAHWIAMATAVHRALARDDVDGIVVVHGTDTMSYTASALAFLLGAIPKPVVLTGAQRPLSDVRSDARANLVDAVIGATLDVPEVVVAFASRLMRGCRTTKVDAWAFDAFDSPNAPPLVALGIGVEIAPHVRKRGVLAPLDPRIEPRVLAVRVFPGLDPRLVIGAIRAGVRGLVLEAFGTGNLPNLTGSSLIPAIEEAASREIPVVVVSQCTRGHVEIERYEGGAAASRAGAIDGGDMTSESAIAKLMVGLGRYSSLDDVRRFMLADIAGERHAI